MAYVSKERKQKIVTDLKPILAKYNIKGTLSINNRSTIVLTIQKSHLDFIGNYEEVLRNDHYRMNKPCYQSAGGGVVFDFKSLSLSSYHTKDQFNGVCRDFLLEAFIALNIENFDHSDIQSDYFYVGWYSQISIGRWDKPYIFEAKEIEEEKRLNALIDTGKLGCKLVDYSDKAIALFGNTKPLKEKLKEIGGKFNPFLNNEGEKMAGWIFPKSKMDELKTILN